LIREVDKESQESDDIISTYLSNGLKVMMLAAITPDDFKNTNRSPRSSLKKRKLVKKLTLQNILENPLKRTNSKFYSSNNVFSALKTID